MALVRSPCSSLNKLSSQLSGKLGLSLAKVVLIGREGNTGLRKSWNCIPQMSRLNMIVCL
ncbi:predicted protein [Botrytis cinerea T4]|uniref:Uncharacterized protein n=1 Tax=Botryotinia fuckeliana (strain T4) TaxID=999810 RepID=G2Y715_BOTF4|nr:predicted protein [Botrytis cinerea T4]